MSRASCSRSPRGTQVKPASMPFFPPPSPTASRSGPPCSTWLGTRASCVARGGRRCSGSDRLRELRPRVASILWRATSTRIATSGARRCSHCRSGRAMRACRSSCGSHATIAIAVLGAAQYNGRPSPVFRARLDHAATLYQRGLAPVILVTGGTGSRDTLSEAEVGRRYLGKLGLPAEGAVALPAGSSTYSSVAGVARWFATKNSKRVLLVSDGFHMLRLRIIASRLGLAPFTSPTPSSPIRSNARLNAGYLLAEGFKVPVTWLFQR